MTNGNKLDTVDCLISIAELAMLDKDVNSVLEDGDTTSDVDTLDIVDCPILKEELVVMDEDVNSVLEEVLVGLIITEVDNLDITTVVGM